jgi:hypothetical protein
MELAYFPQKGNFLFIQFEDVSVPGKSPDEFRRERTGPKIYIVKMSGAWGSRQQFQKKVVGGSTRLLQSAKVNPVRRGIEQRIKFRRSKSREVICRWPMNYILRQFQ